MALSYRVLLPILLLHVAAPLACSGAPVDPSDMGVGGEGGSGSDAPAPCDFGNAPSKCEGSSDLACAPTLTETGRSCDDDLDCQDAELCFVDTADPSQGTCLGIAGECTAIPSPTEGLPFGSACDPTAATDPCAGTCVALGSEGAGECEETCRVGAASGCGESNLDGAAVACAFFAHDLSDAGISQGSGDLGVCAHFCNCNADCPDDQLCLSAPTPDFPGICAGGIQSEDSIATCADGAGGAGGSQP